MNKLILIITMTVMMFALYAQTGLFDLSYGDTKDTALETLKQNGFEVVNDEITNVELAPIDNPLVESIYLSFNVIDSTLDSWSIAYIPQEDEDIESMVMEALVSRHGEGYIWDEFYEQYYWALENNRNVYAGFDYDGIYYWAEYSASTGIPETEDDEEDWDF